ncbi:hypothetical protein AB0395_28095 [Streptosporangium sp. NPDC051023]|uniref:SLOG cluster 4 domain-containing protein n=1 Tax=Streptosporangium sp. NPDC051023 TaxID=3155410 RepID=UPI00344C2C0C
MRAALRHRDVGVIFRVISATFPECTQTRLAVLTQHDRSDISNWVRGTRTGRVSDIEVLTRIADGLQITDEGRMLLGLAPTEPPLSGSRCPPPLPTSADPQPTGLIAICGSRTHDTDSTVIDAAVCALARCVMSGQYQVSHGPVGVGMEVMTYLADHYAPPHISQAVGLFGHRNVVRDVDVVIVVGGGPGTQIEIDLALAMSKKVVALPTSGGTARRFYERACTEPHLRSWMCQEDFTALDTFTGMYEHARLVDAFAHFVGRLLAPGAEND